MPDDRPDPVTVARSFVATHLPGARAAFVGGAVLTEDRTPTSDLDVVAVLDGPPAPYRETFEHQGWAVEAFVHTRSSLDDFWDQDERRRVCSLLRMCVDSVVLVDDGRAAEIRATAARRLAAGPLALTDQELAARRYRLTDLLDDVAGCDREDELAHLAGDVLSATSRLALAVAGAWEASGKALARELRRQDPDLAERLVNGHRHVVLHGDTAVLHRAAVDVLDRAGGPLLVGHRVPAAGGTGSRGAAG